MQRGIPNITTVSTTTRSFNLEGMINPMFYNEGNTNATVFGSTLPPGGQLSFELPFVIDRKAIDIVFSNTEDQDLAQPIVNKLNVYFGTLSKPC